MLTAFATLAAFLRWVVFPLGVYVLASRFAGRSVPRMLPMLLAAGTAIVALGLLLGAVTATNHLQQWDFICFWLYGHAALTHQSVYDPATYVALTSPIPIDPDFVREVNAVGFPYPPPSILLFAPLGVFSNVKVASFLWLGGLLVALVAGIVVLARTYSAKSNSTVAVAVAAVAVSLPATLDNVFYHQTNFLVLLLVALAYLFRKNVGGGVAAGLAVLVKPYLAIVMLWFLARKRWNALVASIATVAVTTIVAIPFLGHGALGEFFTNNPSRREPASLFSESETSSAYSMILRTIHDYGRVPNHQLDALFIVVALAYFALTFYFVIRATAEDDDLTLPIALAFGLMIYPVSTSMYALALVPAIVALAIRARSQSSVALATIGALGFFAGNYFGGATTFFAYLAVYVAAVVISMRDTTARSIAVS